MSLVDLPTKVFVCLCLALQVENILQDLLSLISPNLFASLHMLMLMMMLMMLMKMLMKMLMMTISPVLSWINLIWLVAHVVKSK